MYLESNPDIFDVSLGLTNAADDRSLYIDVLHIFLEETEQNDRPMSEYLEKEDLQNYEILVHALKNNLRTVGAPQAADMAWDLERHCKDGDLGYAHAHHPEMMDAVAVVKKYIRQYLAE